MQLSIPQFVSYFIRDLLWTTIETVVRQAHPKRLFMVFVGKKLVESNEALIAPEVIWRHCNTNIKPYRGRPRRYCYKSPQELIKEFDAKYPHTMSPPLNNLGDLLKKSLGS